VNEQATGFGAAGRVPATIRTADLSDASGHRFLPCSLQWRSFGAIPSFAGPLTTVRCRDDNGLVRAAVEQPGRGRVLVVDGGGSLDTALVGDVLAGLALRHGWSGLVVHGAVRDVVALAGLGIGVVALGTNPRRGRPAGAGETDVPVTFGGVTFHPGLRVVVDEDGVLAESDAAEETGHP
jgi:regulator of ribonuclease activity A